VDQYLLFLCINYALLARDITRSAVRKQLKHDKKLTCRRETARCFVSLNILLSHLWSLKVIENSTIRKLGYGLYSLSIVTMALSCILSEIKRDIGRKPRSFSYLPALDVPVRWGAGGGWFPSKYYHTSVIYGKKTRMVWLYSKGEKFDDLFSLFDRTPACDRQTDGRTSCDRASLHHIEFNNFLVKLYSCAFKFRKVVWQQT